MKFHSKRPKITAQASSVPVFWFTKETARDLKRFTDGLSQRIIEGRVFFILELGKILRDEVRRNAPQILVGDEHIDYAKSLRIAVIDGVEDMDALCIYHKGVTVKLGEDNLRNMALFFRPHMASPDWLSTLVKYGPWPGYLVPVRVGAQDARIISRTVRQDELVSLERRIMQKAAEITSELRHAGAENISLMPGSRAAGMEANEDMGWSVLRAEFGMGEAAARSHWRPAMRAVYDRVDDVLQKYLVYIREGKNLFTLPDDADEQISGMEAQRLAKSGHFMLELAPFIPK